MSGSVPRAPRRNRQFWMNHISQWKGSGLSKMAYCKLHTLNSGSFYNWSRPVSIANKPVKGSKQSSAVALPPDKALSFVPVTVKPSQASADIRFVYVERAATDIALPTDLSPEQIDHWLSAIHQLHV